MCVVSMITDHYLEKWKQPYSPLQPYTLPQLPPPNMPTPAEIEEFHQLLKRAREYDRKHNEPDCELEEKKQRVQKLAKELGVNINFEQ